jgi:trimethylamine:corrinoid methyltransferase-like protein
MEAGGKDFRQRGIVRAKEILKNHHPEYLDTKMADELEKMALRMQAQEIESVKFGKIEY